MVLLLSDEGESRRETTDIEVRTAMLGSHVAGSPCGDTAVLSDIKKKASLRALNFAESATFNNSYSFCFFVFFFSKK